MLDHVELEYHGRLVTADCLSVGVTTVGKARPSNARWQITVDGVTRDGFPGGPEDTEVSVKDGVLAWLAVREERPKLAYLDYEIEPQPSRAPDSNEWTVSVKLWRNHHGELSSQLVSMSNKFASREDAVRHGFVFGQKVIDGDIQPRTA